jgi:hypothetical protein
MFGAAGKETPVGDGIDQSCLGILSYGLMNDPDSAKGKILCYTQSDHRRPPWEFLLLENLFYPLELLDVHFLFIAYN